MYHYVSLYIIIYHYISLYPPTPADSKGSAHRDYLSNRENIGVTVVLTIQKYGIYPINDGINGDLSYNIPFQIPP